MTDPMDTIKAALTLFLDDTGEFQCNSCMRGDLPTARKKGAPNA